MTIIRVDPDTWVEIFDEETSGKFRIYSMLAKIKRSADLPTDGGISIDASEKDPSPIYTNFADGNLKLYVYNSGRSEGYVERDL